MQLNKDDYINTADIKISLLQPNKIPQGITLVVFLNLNLKLLLTSDF